MINPKRYLAALDIKPMGHGGQELIYGEIAGLMRKDETLWLPYPTLCRYLADHVVWASHPSGCSAVYFGTPTIVNDKPLFPETILFGSWTKERERETVRNICASAVAKGFRLIISGLGTGDISVEERLEDMGGGEVVAMKKFDGFTDWVLARIIMKGKTLVQVFAEEDNEAQRDRGILVGRH
jgi:hypothetical protein